jgi:hypothetical protein
MITNSGPDYIRFLKYLEKYDLLKKEDFKFQLNSLFAPQHGPDAMQFSYLV